MASDGEDLIETKTPTQRKHEEMKRKRVCILSFPLDEPCFRTPRQRPALIARGIPSFWEPPCFEEIGLETASKQSRTTHASKTLSTKLTPSQLNERLEREGVKSHKEKVEELNKYLSKLSEHHDMYVQVLFPLSNPSSSIFPFSTIATD